MSKRGHNEGSIYKRDDGRWVACIPVGYLNGKRQRKSFYGETRKRRAKAAGHCFAVSTAEPAHRR